MQGPADPQNCMIWYKRYGFQGSVNYSWSNDQSVLGSARTPHIRIRVNKVCRLYKILSQIAS